MQTEEQMLREMVAVLTGQPAGDLIPRNQAIKELEMLKDKLGEKEATLVALAFATTVGDSRVEVFKQIFAMAREYDSIDAAKWLVAESEFSLKAAEHLKAIDEQHGTHLCTPNEVDACRSTLKNTTELLASIEQKHVLAKSLQ